MVMKLRTHLKEYMKAQFRHRNESKEESTSKEESERENKMEV